MTTSNNFGMPTGVKIDWSEGVEIDNEYFHKDQLDRARYAEFLTNYLLGQSKEKPYVLNLNSAWGTGKTYFLKRWKYDLEKHHPVIYIDAWKDDHSDDPFMTVVSAIISSLRELTDKPESSILSKGFENGWSLLKAMGPLMVGAAAKKYLGKDIDELASLTEENSPDIRKDVGDAAVKMAQFLISSHEKKSESVKALKLDILGWIDAVVGQNNELGKPTFVIIDELDRCRPSYAVEMLEAVKHIFDITGVYFIIATDTEQLQHAIKVVYGEEFDAQTYLSRFFDSRFSLREASLKTLIEAHCNVTVFKMEYCIAKGINFWPYSNNHLDNIISIFDTFKLSPRVAIQVVNRISATIINMKAHTSVDICYLAILHSIRIVEPTFYSNLISIGRLGDYNNFFKGKDYFHSGNKIFITTDLSQGPVEMSLSKYFETIFLYVSNIFENHAGTKISVDGLTAREIEEDLASEKSINRRSIHDESFHTRLLQFEYLQSAVRKINKKSYKDMVELAVSFD